MKFKLLKTVFLGVILSVSWFGNIANAGIIFQDDFENGFSSDWLTTGTSLIIDDPLETDKALTFPFTTSGYNASISLTGLSFGDYTFSFDYLGTCGGQDCGGSIRTEIDNAYKGYIGSHTGHNGYLSNLLMDTGGWGDYEDTFIGVSSSLFFSFQDWTGAARGNTPRDAFFDNIVITNVTDVPEPTTLAIFALGLMGLASRRFKKQS